MKKIKIHGGRPLKGEVTISGAKNSAVALIPAAILADSPVILEGVPDIQDVHSLMDILEIMGVKTTFQNNTLEIDPTELVSIPMPSGKINSLRASYYFMGALLGRFGEAVVGLPGGCYLGPRPIDLHIKGFEMLGAKVTNEHGAMYLRTPDKKLHGERIFLDMVSIGATINIMLAAVKAEGKTIIENAAREPEIIDVATLLNNMGAKIRGAGTNEIRIEGVEKLHGCRHSIIPDRIEAGTYLAMAAAVGEGIKVNNVIYEHLESYIAKLEELGVPMEVKEDSIEVFPVNELNPVIVKTYPYPGFATDLQQPITPLLMKAKGTSDVIDTIYAGEVSGKKVGEKEAVRLMTGAPIPQGADTVIRQEDVERVGDTISVFQEQHAYENYCYAGEDYSAGTCLLTRGETVGAAECGLLASMGYSHAKVVRNMRAAVIATGSELTEPGSELSFGKIYNANLYLVCSRLTELGVSVVWMDTVQDDARCLKDSIEKACRLDADLILTIGGVSVGQKDIVEETYGLLGAEICFHGVKMKPGSPMMGGSYQKIPMLSFSGNPYGTFVNMELFVLPVLEKMTGSQRYRVEYREGTLAETFEKTGKVPRFVRARWENGTVVWKRQNASGILSSLNGCNCLLEIPPGIEEGRKKGEKVWVRMLSSR